MLPDPPNESTAQEAQSTRIQQVQILPFDILLQNIIPMEIVAKRFPIDKAIEIASLMLSHAHIQLSLSDLGIDADALQAQINLEVNVSFPHEPRLFEIHFKLAGIFNYAQGYDPGMVLHFLQQGSLSVMLPFARELLLNLCTRLQVPMVALPLVQLSPPQPPHETETGNISVE